MKTVLLIGGLFLSILSVSADDVLDKFNADYFRSPEASAFKKYGEESVNEYTGTADISVPLYTIKCKDLEIPLVLRYDASGIKVEQEASWVGLGWNLMVGGCINYVCAGGHDMYGAPNVDNKVWTEYLTSEFGKWTHADSIRVYDYNPNFLKHDKLQQTVSWEYRTRTMYYTYDSKDKFNWMAKQPLHSPCIDSYLDLFIGDESGYGMKEYIESGYGERDFYSVNVMGKSFMFFIDPFTLKVFNIGKAGEDFVVNPDHGIFTPKTGIGNQTDVEKWRITDSDGYNYYFTVGDKYQRDYSSPQPYTSCWYLTKIKSPTGETVELEYDSVMKPGRSILVESVNLPFPHDICCIDATDRLRTSSGESTQSENAGMSVTSHYLSKIKTQNQTVTFVTSNDDRCSGLKLDAIKIVSTNDNSTIKTINFSYGSFQPSQNPLGGNYAPNDPSIKSQDRLKLNNIMEIASGETLITGFLYNEDVKLPSKRSYAQDYWGYYNGKENKVGNKYTMIPTPQSFMSSYYSSYNGERSKYSDIGGANRNSDGYYMQAAILNKIVYPTGGYTTYEYEPNRCVVSPSESDRPYDIDIQKYFSYTPDVPAGVNPVSNAPYNFTLKEELDFTLSVKCDGSAIDGQSFNVIIVGGSSPKVIPVTYKNQTKKVVLQDKLPAGSYQLMIGAPSTGTKNYGICCQLTGYYNSNTSAKQPQTTYTKSVGGLRVTRICNYDNDGKKINYTEYGYSGGVLLNRIETIDFIQKFNNDAGIPPSGYEYIVQHTINLYTITAGHPHMPAFFASCIPGIVGYDRVTKSKYDANGNLEKSVTTSYKNNSPQSNNTYGIEYLATFDNGVIMSQEIRNASGGIVAKTENTYVNDPIAHYATNMIAKSKTLPSMQGVGNGTTTLSYELRERHDKTGSITREIATVEVLPCAYQILRYPYFLSRSNLEKTITTEYCPNDSTIITTKKYSYNDKNHQVSQIDEYRSKDEKDARNGISLTKQFNRTKIKYTVDDSKYKSMVNNYHRLNGVVETQNILVENGKENYVNTQRTDYKYGDKVFSLPDFSSTSVGNAPLETRATYTYDDYCNVRSVTIDGQETVYIWSYKGQYPIAKIEGLTYAEVENAITKSTITELLRSQTPNSTTISSIRTKINAKGGYITTYTYKPLVGILSETQPNGNTIYYEYDSFGRLKNIKDHNKKIIKTYEYHYSAKK